MAYKDKAKALAYWKEYNLARKKERVKQARAVAIENGEQYYFTGKPCINGHVGVRRVKDRKCKVCELEATKQYANENTKKVRERKKLSYIKCREHNLLQKQEYRKANGHKINALNKAYKIRKMNRIPKWVTADEMWLIKEAYTLAKLRTKLHGFSWHVDHILPLQGDLVSGLHVPTNLQVIPWLDNVKKKNKFEVA